MKSKILKELPKTVRDYYDQLRKGSVDGGSDKPVFEIMKKLVCNEDHIKMWRALEKNTSPAFEGTTAWIIVLICGISNALKQSAPSYVYMKKERRSKLEKSLRQNVADLKKLCKVCGFDPLMAYVSGEGVNGFVFLDNLDASQACHFADSGRGETISLFSIMDQAEDVMARQLQSDVYVGGNVEHIVFASEMKQLIQILCNRPLDEHVATIVRSLFDDVDGFDASKLRRVTGSLPVPSFHE